MSNPYIFYPKLDIDFDLVKEIAIRNMWRRVDGLASHQRRVRDEPYLESVRERYPFLSQLYNIYTTPPGYKVPIHICPERGCGLNIPVIYTEDSHTIFYEGEQLAKDRSNPRIYDIINSEVREVFRYTLTEPVIMNTMLPHSVVGGPLRSRTIMSWSILTSYEETKQLVSVL
jgi:hypothetical protein